jgi:hypothetical protein
MAATLAEEEIDKDVVGNASAAIKRVPRLYHSSVVYEHHRPPISHLDDGVIHESTRSVLITGLTESTTMLLPSTRFETALMRYYHISSLSVYHGKTEINLP